jgi:KAP family P-loop domain
MRSYVGYKILLDSPADIPALGFGQFAGALGEIVTESDPRFAVGIFGNWGSGKTTLMRAIRARLSEPPASDRVVPVWFNAWRYEKEEHMIVPLLDVLRDELVRWAEKRPPESGVRRSAMKAAAVSGRAARAIMAGLTLKVKAPGWMGGPEVGFDGDKFLTELRQDDDKAASTPQSFYHASFTALDDAFKGFVHEGQGERTGEATHRVVVFVDDLDRCLPPNALQVLESMKLFFDLSGFVFVVGLDHAVIRRAIESKYGERVDGEQRAQPGRAVLGAEYIKKIFQVPFTLPPVSIRQLDEFIATFSGTALSDDQADDLAKNVRPHLDYLVGDSGVNPREVKRFLNAYTLQMKTRPNLDADVVLTMQTLSFRPDWAEAYQALLAEPEAFTSALRNRGLEAPNALEGLWPELAGTAADLAAYFAMPKAAALLNPALDLNQYIYSVESTRTANPALAEIYPKLGSLRERLRQFDPAALDAADRFSVGQGLNQDVRGLLRVANRTLDPAGPGGALLQGLDQLGSRIPAADAEVAAWNAWRQSAEALLARLRDHLLNLSRAASGGPGSAPAP